MALTSKSLFLYGLEVTVNNQNIPFRAVAMGPQLNAVIPVGFYSLTSIAAAIKKALQVADPLRVYTVTLNRTILGGTENRITISTNGAFLELLFLTGTLAASSIRSLTGWGSTDYTGATTYTNAATSGTALVTEWFGKNYQSPDVFVKNFGSVNVAANGEKESITWAIQRFVGVEFEYEPQAKAFVDWRALIGWMIQQKPFDFTPEISSPSVVHEVTLEKSSDDGKGLGFNMKEQVPRYPFMFTTGPMVMRVRGEG